MSKDHLPEKPPTTTKKRSKSTRLGAVLPKLVSNLRDTLITFPSFDLMLRALFEDAESQVDISGRTFKKLVTTKDLEESAAAAQADSAEIYMLKKNAREMHSTRHGGKKTPSADMDLQQNHKESFREICALRLFQLIWGDPAAVPSDARIVLSKFKKTKPENAAKALDSKVYVAIKQVEGLPFDIARLEVQNLEALKKDDSLMRQFCQQIIVQAILSNIDAIKLDNVFVDATKGKVVQLDFGDARFGEDEKKGPDPDFYSTLDNMRQFIDKSTNRSTKSMLHGNAIYANSLNFFHNNVTADDLLAVIEKLKSIPEKTLWQVAYVYSYGSESEKKSYADCLIARVRNFVFLEDKIKEIAEAGSQEQFFKTSLRSLVSEDPTYRAKKANDDMLKAIEKIFQKAAEISDKITEEEEVKEESEEEDLDDDEQNSDQEESESEEEEEIDEYEKSEELSSNVSDESEEKQEKTAAYAKAAGRTRLTSATYDSDESSQEGSDESEKESENEIDEEEVDEEFEAEKKALDSLMEAINEEFENVLLYCENSKKYLIAPSLHKAKEAEAGPAEQPKLDARVDNLLKSDDEFSTLVKKINELRLAMRANIDSNIIHSKMKMDTFLQKAKKAIFDTAFKIITNKDAYDTFNAVVRENFSYDKKIDFVDLSKALESVAVNVSDARLAQGRAAKEAILSPLKTAQASRA